MWQPTAVLYPDIEQVLANAARAAGLGADFIGRNVPRTITTAILFNRIGGTQIAPLDTANVMVRVYAPTDAAVNALALDVLRALPTFIDGKPITHIEVTGGPTDLGLEQQPMRQILAYITQKGSRA